MTTDTRSLSKNIISRYCKIFAITPSSSTWNVNVNISELKLVRTVWIFRETSSRYVPFTSQPEFPEFLGKWKTPVHTQMENRTVQRFCFSSLELLFCGVLVPSIERFHSRGQQPYRITETKEGICIKIVFNSRRIILIHHHGPHSFVWNINMAAVTSCENSLYGGPELLTTVGNSLHGGNVNCGLQVYEQRGHESYSYDLTHHTDICR